MNPQAEIAPFFSTGTDPVLLKDAQDILRSLRGGVNVWNGQQRQALAGISALLACERHGQPLVSYSAAQKMSASSPTVFSFAHKKCRAILEANPLVPPSPRTASASGRKSMASPRSAATPSRNTEEADERLVGFQEEDWDDACKGKSNGDVDVNVNVNGKVIAHANSQGTADTYREVAAETKGTAIPAVLARPPIPPQSPSQPPPTPQTPSKPRPTSATGRASLAASPTPRRLAGRTPTGHGSPMHNALMKGKLEMASAVRLAGGRGKERALDEEEEEEVMSPSRRQKTGPASAAREARKGVDLVQVLDSPQADDPTTFTTLGERATVSAQKINSLFYPLPTFPLDPYTPIPQPPLVFSGPSIFYAPTLAQGRIAAKTVPPDDIAWGDPYSLMSRRRCGQGSLSVLAIEVGQVGEASAKRERARKRRLKRLMRLESGLTTADGEAPWDREFGVPLDTGVEAADVGADWQERLDLYHAKISDGLHATIDALSKRSSDATLQTNEPPLNTDDRQWIARAESHGIAIRVHQDA
ncbi:hypothetical protein QFC20_001761 [Naganishia adeliensis]|uniref:Uncharacterized protein n=1 Tax=Naganishia adeliensis TaxID=92952 RepID=A0ACC2WQQ0_9TREE|nr:hypothetical protein QFC20_001761 [Naganishia adeliensis]